MSHIAFQEKQEGGSPVDWMEKVTEEQSSPG